MPLGDAVGAMFPRRDVDADRAADLRHGRPLPPSGVAGAVGVFDPAAEVLALVEDSRGAGAAPAGRAATRPDRTSGQAGHVQRWRGLSAAPTGWGRCVVTIGVYDGVHRGHRQIIGRAVERARGGRAALRRPHLRSASQRGPAPRHRTRRCSPAAVQGGAAGGARRRRAVRASVHPASFQPTRPGRFVHEVLVDAAARKRRRGG